MTATAPKMAKLMSLDEDTPSSTAGLSAKMSQLLSGADNVQ